MIQPIHAKLSKGNENLEEEDMPIEFTHNGVSEMVHKTYLCRDYARRTCPCVHDDVEGVMLYSNIYKHVTIICM